MDDESSSESSKDGKESGKEAPKDVKKLLTKDGKLAILKETFKDWLE